ncbi:hypothetical protein MHBO_000237 [Bonamia ostreae]|uniref:Uncharacterized protein n=1 Tax=Bonamia ostreae TaxID=126728 RepID=A0ABV2AFL9_9EUKA
MLKNIFKTISPQKSQKNLPNFNKTEKRLFYEHCKNWLFASFNNNFKYPIYAQSLCILQYIKSSKITSKSELSDFYKLFLYENGNEYFCILLGLFLNKEVDIQFRKNEKFFIDETKLGKYFCSSQTKVIKFNMCFKRA